MTIQSKRGKNTTLRGTQISQSPNDRAVIKRHREIMKENPWKLVGYHKRRRRSMWKNGNGDLMLFTEGKDNVWSFHEVSPWETA